MSKSRTFKDWYSSLEKEDFIDVGCLAEKSWHNARIGMIPEDEAIKIPPVENWPKWAKGIRAIYCEGTSMGDPGASGDRWGFEKGEKIAPMDGVWINRPVPTWYPKVGDRVFARMQLAPGSYVTLVGVVKYIKDRASLLLVIDGLECAWSSEEVKSFNEKYIYYRWDAIPPGEAE